MPYGIRVRNDFGVEFVHGQERRVVVLEVNETVIGVLPSDLVLHDLDGDDVVFAHDVQSSAQEGLVHVGLEL